MTPLERAYEVLAPVVFHAAQGWQHLSGAAAEDLRARRGWVPAASGSAVWFHGASAGEMSAAVALAAMLQERGFSFSAVFSAANRAGVEYVRRSRAGSAIAALAPWDTRDSLRRTFARWQPQMIFLVETELWPRLVYEAAIRAIPVFCVSARIYARDVKRYRALKRFFAPTLRRLTRIIAQDETERRRFRQIGAPECVCVNGGNLKYLRPPPPARRAALAAELGIASREPVIVVGSLHRDEALGLLAALRRADIPLVRILVAPRHLSSAEFIVEEARKLGFTVQRRSQPTANQWRLLVVDSIGELQHFYSIATCAVVGGGFKKHGGHNPFEPVFAGAPVAFGPHFDNFQSEARALASATPEARVENMDQLQKLLRLWLGNDSRRTEMRQLQRAAVPDGDAIADRYLEVLAPWLSAMRA